MRIFLLSAKLSAFQLIVQSEAPKRHNVAHAHLNVVLHDIGIWHTFYLALALLASAYLEGVPANREVGHTRGGHIIAHAHLVVEECLAQVADVGYSARTPLGYVSTVRACMNIISNLS